MIREIMNKRKKEMKTIQEIHDNTILEKGSFYVLKGVEPGWSEHGLTEVEWNGDYGHVRPMVLNGKLYKYDEGVCKPFEVIRCVTEVVEDVTLSEVYDDYENGWLESPLYTHFGILSETIPKVIPISKRQMELNLHNPIYVGNVKYITVTEFYDNLGNLSELREVI